MSLRQGFARVLSSLFSRTCPSWPVSALNSVMQVVDMYESGGRLGMTVAYASFDRVLGSDVRPDSDRIRAAARHQLPAMIQGCKTPRAASFGSQRMIGLICVRWESLRFSGFGKARCVERVPDMMSSPTPRRCKCRIIPQRSSSYQSLTTSRFASRVV